MSHPQPTDSPVRAVTAGDLLEQIERLTVDDLRVWAGRFDDAADTCRALLRRKLQLARRQQREASYAD
jgi:hypothetical protein